MNSNHEYPNGYFPKLQYWTKVLEGMVQSQDIEGIVWATNKIQYFTQRQKAADLILANITAVEQ